MVQVAQRMAVPEDVYESVFSIAYTVAQWARNYHWAAAGLAGGTLSHAGMWGDLVSEALCYVHAGQPANDAIESAIKTWASEQFKNANVYQRRLPDGTNEACIKDTVTESIAEWAGPDPYDVLISRLDYEQLIRTVRAGIRPEEWDLLVRYMHAETYAALGRVLGVSTNTARRRVLSARASAVRSIT
jgi:DNA-directed RNA polymerase specialized sigma24 family protein